MKALLAVLTTVTLLGCNQANKKEATEEPTSEVAMETVETPVEEKELTPGQKFAQTIEQAHQKERFSQKDNVSFDLVLSFGGQERVNDRVSMNTATSKLRLDSKNGTAVVYDGTDIFITPKDAEQNGVRFGIFTWTYFFALPFKLSDPGVNIALQGEKQLADTTYTTSKLTFDNNIGDAPDDWYILYTNPQTAQLEAAAYIVTYGTGDVEKAESDPHAITYGDYVEVEGIPIATTWKFYGWNEEQGLTDQLGEAKISNITFNKVSAEMFDKPENAARVE